MSYQQDYSRSYSNSPSYSSSPSQSTYSTNQYSSETQGRVISHPPTTVGERVEVKPSCGFISIRYGYDVKNLPNHHSTQTYSYTASQGRESWLRTYEQDQEWLKKLSNGSARPTETLSEY